MDLTSPSSRIDRSVTRLLRWVHGQSYSLDDAEWAYFDHLISNEFRPRAPFWGIAFVCVAAPMYRRGEPFKNLGCAALAWAYGYEFGFSLRHTSYDSKKMLRDLSHLETPLGEEAKKMREVLARRPPPGSGGFMMQDIVQRHMNANNNINNNNDNSNDSDDTHSKEKEKEDDDNTPDYVAVSVSRDLFSILVLDQTMQRASTMLRYYSLYGTAKESLHPRERLRWAWELKADLVDHPDVFTRWYWRGYFLYHQGGGMRYL
eukprot:PhM_4_TR2304/c0_g1_i1/m.11520